MRAIRFILTCLLCAAGGTVIGHYTQHGSGTNPGGKRSPGVARSVHPEPMAQEKAFQMEKSGPRRSALILEMASRGQSGRLGVLIEACAHDDLALRMLADAWLKTDPAAFVRAMAESRLVTGTQRERMELVLADVIERWGRKDPDAAWQSADNLSGYQRQFMLGKLALMRIESDPQKGLEFVLQHPGIVPNVSGKNFPAMSRDLLPLIQQLPDSGGKFKALRSALKEVPVAEAMEAVGHSSNYVAANARRVLLKQAAEKSLDEVVAYHGQATGANRYAAARAIGDQLLKQDPAAAVTWARENLSGGYRTGTIKTAAEALEKSDPAAAETARVLLPKRFTERSP